MAQNPQPDHITAGMWWFIEEWERMEPATVFAGAWGRAKPGYHCDSYGLWWHKDENGVYSWRGDYSLQLADDKVLGTSLEQFGAAVDITFPDAQNGNYTTIRKYSDRIKAAWVARDPRLVGWREVLCNCSDNDSSADGFDIPGHYERTPDDTHKWHIHFSCSRRYLGDLKVWQAMMSILRGETLAQWLAGGSNDMATVFRWDNKYWISRGDAAYREVVVNAAGAPCTIGVVDGAMNVVCNAHRVYPDTVKVGQESYPSSDLKISRGWTEAQVTLAFGPVKTISAPTDLSPEDIAAIAAGARAGALEGAKVAIAGATISGTIAPAS